MSDDAGRNAWLQNMAALGAVGGSSGEPAQTDDHPGMTAIANLQPLSAATSASAAAIPTVDEPSKSPEPRGVGLSIGPLIQSWLQPARGILGRYFRRAFVSALTVVPIRLSLLATLLLVTIWWTSPRCSE